MRDVNEMTPREVRQTLIRFAHRDEDELLEMDEDELYAIMEMFIDEFDESGLRKEIEDSGYIDLDDSETTIYDVLTEWSDLNDDSDLFPNGKDDE